jgi:hypothetical protein
MTFPLPFPDPILPPADIDFAELFTSVSSAIQHMRTRRNLLPLVPNGVVQVGQETLSEEFDAPCIRVVPRGMRFQPGETRYGDFSRQFLQMQWIQCECHLWGDDDPKKIDPLYSFGSTVELLRELVVALASALGSITNLHVDGGRWEQKTDVNRSGRVFVADIALRYFILTDPPLLVPIATATKPGVQADVTANLQTADGSSTVTEAIFLAPP